MNIIFDTNMIYYISGISDSYLDSTKITELLKNYATVYISEISMLVQCN